MADVFVALDPVTISGGNGWKVKCNPERVNLDGLSGSKITWKPEPGTVFLFSDDIHFVADDGMFDVQLQPDGTITATTTREEEVEHVYIYFLTVRREGINDFAIIVDPEVDNPPPPRP